jgi:hypothetical protein
MAMASAAKSGSKAQTQQQEKVNNMLEGASKAG